MTNLPRGLDKLDDLQSFDAITHKIKQCQPESETQTPSAKTAHFQDHNPDQGVLPTAEPFSQKTSNAL
jgi:hypothetical protein